MTTKELIRAEIKKLRDIFVETAKGMETEDEATVYSMCAVEFGDELLAFLDTMPDEPITTCNELEGKKTFDDYLKASPSERRKMNMTEILGEERLAKTKRTMEPVSDCHDLAEAAETKYPTRWKKYPNDGIVRSEEYFDLNAEKRDAFKAGAEWMKTKILKDNPVIMSVEDFQALIDSHAKRVEADYREKMMGGAVDADVLLTLHDKTGDISLHTGYLPKELGIKYGDKVKIIIVKEEER